MRSRKITNLSFLRSIGSHNVIKGFTGSILSIIMASFGVVASTGEKITAAGFGYSHSEFQVFAKAL